jgi:hypothetical protein
VSQKNLTILNDPRRIYRADIPNLRIDLKGYSPSGTSTFVLNTVFEAQVVNNNFYEADRFSIEAALSGLPAPYNTIGWWGAQKQIEVKISAGLQPFGPGGGTVLIEGLVDMPDLRLRSNVLSLSGRDWTSRFIDTMVSDTFLNIQNGKIFLNMTGSQIVTQLAAQYPDISNNPDTNIWPTSTPVGTYAMGQNAIMFRNRTLWDVMTWLANQETDTDSAGVPQNYVCYVKGKALYWGPQQAPDGIFQIQWGPQSNLDDLELSRNLSLANDVRVTVQGWGPLGRYQAVASGKHRSAPSVIFPAGYQHYVYTINGLTVQQASAKATALAKGLTQHELVARASLPADFSIDPYGAACLVGTDSEWDTDYWINSVTWRFGMGEEEGAAMDLWLKNHPVNMEVTLPSP